MACIRCRARRTKRLVSTFAARIAATTWEIKRGQAHNPYANLTLQHVRDERGKPITVHSEAELHAAEKKYNFVHAATWGLEKEPPKHEQWAGQINHHRKPKFNRNPAAYSPEEVRKVQLGGTLTPSDTLAGRPNSNREVGT